MCFVLMFAVDLFVVVVFGMVVLCEALELFVLDGALGLCFGCVLVLLAIFCSH